MSDIIDILKKFMTDEEIRKAAEKSKKEKEENAEIDYLVKIAQAIAAVNNGSFKCDYNTKDVIVYLPNGLGFAEETFLRIKRINVMRLPYERGYRLYLIKD